MITYNDLTKKPFYLDEKDIAWVKKTFDAMSIDDKIGQLFFMVSYKQDEEFLKKVCKDIKIGGMMLRPMLSDDVKALTKKAQSLSEIPLLLSANLETGANGVAHDGTKVAAPMAVAATRNVENAYKFGEVIAKEASSLGINYSFSPISDLDLNFRNPITNTRTFGHNVDDVIDYSKAVIHAFDDYNMATSVKHFPGDGVDERDQHLLTAINDLTVPQWDNSYGRIYQSLIDDGVKSIMVGHIALPNYSRLFRPNILDKDILPASLSKEIMQDLLRKKLGFNGMIISDATTMGGFNIPVARDIAVPLAVEAGCDMFLFTKNLDEDVAFMKQGYAKKILSNERLSDAVMRILALKASLKLYETKKVEPVQLKNASHQALAETISDQSITLVKSEKDVLPITPKKYKNVLIYGLESGANALGYVREQHVHKKLGKLLKKEGYVVEYFETTGVYEGMQSSLVEMKAHYDLIIYVANLATKSNQTTVRIEWANPMGVNLPFYIQSIPTIFISTENPYHLLDVPRVKTYINTYGVNDFTITHLVDKLSGRSPFKGVSPVDPFCGKWDAKLQ